MKTAVLVSGQARTFRSCWPNQLWHFFRRLDSPEFFVSMADDAQADDLKVIGETFPFHFEKVQQPAIPETETMKRANFSGYGCSASMQNILRAFWHYQRVWELFNERPNQNVGEYGTFVRIRPDLWFQDYEHPFNRLNEIAIHECWTPWWGSYSGVNDRLAIMGERAARVYMTAFSKLEELLESGCPFHPETLTRAALESEEIRIIQRLLVEFRIRRMPDAQHASEWLVLENFIPHEIMRPMLLK